MQISPINYQLNTNQLMAFKHSPTSILCINEINVQNDFTCYAFKVEESGKGDDNQNLKLKSIQILGVPMQKNL